MLGPMGMLKKMLIIKYLNKRSRLLRFSSTFLRKRDLAFDHERLSAIDMKTDMKKL